MAYHTSMSDVKKILIRCPNWLGDIVMSLPIFETLKKAFPDAEVHALVKSPFHEIFRNDSRIDRVIPFQKKSTLFQKLNVFKLTKEIKKENYDLCICLTRSISSALPLYLARIKKRIGAKRFLGSFLLTDQITLNKKQHQRKQYLSFLQPLDLSQDVEFTHLKMPEKDADIFKSLKVDGPYILCHPGASYGSAKTWPLEYFEKLASYFFEKTSFKVIFVGDASQKKPNISHPQLLDLTGQTSLHDLMTLMASAHLVICNDSGPMHISDGLGTKLLAIFGPTDPTLTGPKNTHSHIIFNKTDCGPCFERICPLDHKCMRQINPEMIFQKALTILEGHGTP
jgi:heptosyltransferase II